MNSVDDISSAEPMHKVEYAYQQFGDRFVCHLFVFLYYMPLFFKRENLWLQESQPDIMLLRSNDVSSSDCRT